MSSKEKRRDMLPFWTDAYLADTTHLDLEHHGAYVLLLVKAWRNAGADSPPSLPDDDTFMKNTLSITPKKWSVLKPYIMAFWTLKDGRWTQKKLTKMWREDQDFRDDQSQKGKRGGRPSSQKSGDNRSQRAEDVAEKSEQKQRNQESPAEAEADIEGITKVTPSYESAEKPKPKATVQRLEILNAWNRMAERHNLPKALTTNIGNARNRAIVLALKEMELSQIISAIERVPLNPHWLGRNDSGWKAGIDFVLKPDRLIQSLEFEPTKTLGTPNDTRNYNTPRNQTYDQQQQSIRERRRGALLRAAEKREAERASGQL